MQNKSNFFCYMRSLFSVMYRTGGHSVARDWDQDRLVEVMKTVWVDSLHVPMRGTIVCPYGQDDWLGDVDKRRSPFEVVDVSNPIPRPGSKGTPSDRHTDMRKHLCMVFVFIRGLSGSSVRTCLPWVDPTRGINNMTPGIIRALKPLQHNNASVPRGAQIKSLSNFLQESFQLSITPYYHILSSHNY